MGKELEEPCRDLQEVVVLLLILFQLPPVFVSLFPRTLSLPGKVKQIQGVVGYGLGYMDYEGPDCLVGSLQASVSFLGFQDTL